MTKTLTPEAQAKREAQKAKIKAARERKRELRETTLFASGPYALRPLDADNLVIETAGGDPLYYPRTVDGYRAAISWMLAQLLCPDRDSLKTQLRRADEILEMVQTIAEALAKEAGR